MIMNEPRVSYFDAILLPRCRAINESGSVELTWEEIRHVCVNYGLKIVHEEKREALYNANRSSLIRTAYTGVLCSAVKTPKK